MGKYCVLVMGPAGSGKSSFCALYQNYCIAAKRTVHFVNLDPAAEDFKYEATLDVRDMIKLDDVMDQLDYGPNGGLVFCYEYLLENLSWLQERVDDYEDDYLVIDFPGQTELFSHSHVVKDLVGHFQSWGYNMCGVYLLDSHFLSEATKFVSGCLSCLSTMIQMEIPHINVISKCDLLQSDQDTEMLEECLNSDVEALIESIPDRYSGLHSAIGDLLREFNMVSFIPCNPEDDDSFPYVLSHIDNALQFGEDVEPILRE